MPDLPLPSSTARVVLITNFLPPYRVGLLRQVSNLLPNLQILVSTPMESNRQWQPDWQGLEVCVQKNLTLRQHWHHPKGFSEELYVHFPYDTFQQLLARQPDVTISNEFGFRTLMAALYRRWNRRNRLIIWATLSQSSEQGRGKLRDGLRRWLLQQADAVVVNGSSGERYIRSFSTHKPIAQIPYSTSVEALAQVARQRTIQAPPQRLLYVGQLTPRKGLLELAQALQRWGRRFPQRLVQLKLVGKGSLRAELESFDWPANVQLEIQGHMPYEQIAQAYAKADLFVFPTLADEWGLVTNEALAAGLPVLGSVYSQAVEELVKDGDNGWLMRPDIPQDFDAALERALGVSSQELAAASEAAIASVKEITHKSVARQMASLVGQMLEGSL